MCELCYSTVHNFISQVGLHSLSLSRLLIFVAADKRYYFIPFQLNDSSFFTGIFCIDALLVKGTQQNATGGCWQWRDDRGIWHNYMWVDNRILEAAHQSGEDEISLSTLGRNYIIDFTNMQQVWYALACWFA